MAELTEGMTVFIRWAHRAHVRELSEMTVGKVGRKWAKLSGGYRLNVSDLTLDGGNYSSPGRAYLSKGDFETDLENEKTWSAFRNEVEKLLRPRLSASAIRQAAELLGLELKVKP